jgi:hypothetical protein
MSAREYLARADALAVWADAASDYGDILRAEAMATQWRRLADLAKLQDTLIAALARCDRRAVDNVADTQVEGGRALV